MEDETDLEEVKYLAEGHTVGAKDFKTIVCK